MIIKKLKTWWQSRNYYVIADGNDNSITLSKRLFLHIKGKAKKGDAAQVFVFRIAGQDSFGFTSIQISDNRLNYAIFNIMTSISA